MSAEGAAVVRPRTTGELLDDAWRLAIADAPALLLLSGVFLAPAFAALVLLAGLSAPANPALRLLPPLLPLALFVLSGVGSGACQEWFRARADARKPSPAGCLAAAFRRGLPHGAARALVLVGPLLGLGAWLSTVGLTERPAGTADGWLLLWCLLITAVACLPGLLLWPFTAMIHPYLASGKARESAGLGEYLRQTGADAGKSGAVTLTRTALLLLVIVNLVLLVKIGLWILDGVAGLDAAFVGLQLSIANPVYDLTLVLSAWLLLAPFFEASNFLLYVDARSRHEGLDLQVRVRRVFPTTERRRVGALAVLAGLLWFSGPARADSTYDAVHAARQDVQAVHRKAEADDPYRGAPWQNALDQTADHLERAAGQQRFGWFRKAIDGFADLPKDDALRVLGDLDQRLALLEETLPHGEGNHQAAPSDDFKKMLQQSGGRRPTVQPEDDTDQKKADDEKDKKDAEKKDDQKSQPDDQQGGSLVSPAAVPGCGQVGLMLAAGLMLAVLLVGVVMFIAARRKGPAPARKPLVPAKSVRQTTERQEALPVERPAADWQREADALARKEEYLEAVRALYLAVLSLLHGRRLLRFEPTRTNGEYIQQVRLAPQAPPALHTVFEEFTSLFERKWYGDRVCEAAEYRAARGLAEEIQAQAREIS